MEVIHVCIDSSQTVYYTRAPQTLHNIYISKPAGRGKTRGKLPLLSHDPHSHLSINSPTRTDLHLYYTGWLCHSGSTVRGGLHVNPPVKVHQPGKGNWSIVKNNYSTFMQCSRQAWFKAWWELGHGLGGVYRHIKGNPYNILKACWADMPYVYWEEYCTCTVVSQASAHSRASAHVPHFKGSMYQLLYKCMEVISR
jgi:hypothetical protein